MKQNLFLLCIALVPCAIHGADAPHDITFTKRQLSDEFWAEGAAVADFNKDGKRDVAYGPYWWEGTDFKVPHTFYPDAKRSTIKNADGTMAEIKGYKGALGRENDYSDHFLTFSFDFNGDGWADILVFGFPGKETFWFENPKGGDQPWKKHLALDVTDNESPTLVDVDGDGRPEIVCTSGGYIGYASFDPAKPDARWAWHRISTKGDWQRFTHGLGVGDVNGDKRMDLLEANGWWEQPASLAGDPVWTHHEALFGPGGAQMFAYDVNGDGKNDIVTSLQAHGYGIAWFEQTSDGWTQHLITGKTAEETRGRVHFSQPHAVALADVNGDGLLDIVTGKRFWAHGPDKDPEPNEPPVLYWFELMRGAGNTAQFIPHMMDDLSGVGTQVTANDLNGDGRMDIIVGNKRGAFVFLQNH